MDLTGQVLGRYQIVEKIGSGGMADVYKARQESLDRYVAIKVLPAVLGRDEIFRARFVQEAKAVAQLHHPNILKVFDYGEQEDITYIVMEHVPGGTLQDRMGKPLSLKDTIEIIGRVGEALAYAHRRGVIHRDVKPSNVLLTEGGWPLLSDFGLAKMVEGSKKLTRSGVSIGTPEYMSPEQGQGLAADYRSDIYSLGVILYEMVTGQAPYTAETPMAVILKHMSEPLPSPRILRPELPVGIESVIVRAMAKAPQDRYTSAAEMVTALKRAWEQITMGLDRAPEKIDALPDSMIRPFETPIPVSPRKRSLAWVVWFVLVLLIGGAALIWAFFPGFAAMFPFEAGASPTTILTPTRIFLATPTFTPMPTNTSVPVSKETATPTPTLLPTSTSPPSPTLTHTPTATPTPTRTSTPSPTPTPLPEAVANTSSSIFKGPHSETETLAVVAERESVSILGRADEAKYGRWLHVRNRGGIEGFVFAPRFTYTVDWESLPVIE